MSSSLSHCVIKLHEEHHDLEDYQGGVPRCCSGCGDNAILAAVQRLCRCLLYTSPSPRDS